MEVQKSSGKRLRSKSSKSRVSRESVNIAGWEGSLASVLIWGEVKAQYANTCRESLRTWVQYVEFMLIKKKKNQAWWHVAIQQALERQKRENRCVHSPPYWVCSVSSCQGEILSPKTRDGLLRNKTTVYSGIHTYINTYSHTQKHTHPPIRMHTNDPSYTQVYIKNVNRTLISREANIRAHVKYNLWGNKNIKDF